MKYLKSFIFIVILVGSVLGYYALVRTYTFLTKTDSYIFQVIFIILFLIGWYVALKIIGTLFTLLIGKISGYSFLQLRVFGYSFYKSNKIEVKELGKNFFLGNELMFFRKEPSKFNPFFYQSASGIFGLLVTVSLIITIHFFHSSALINDLLITGTFISFFITLFDLFPFNFSYPNSGYKIKECINQNSKKALYVTGILFRELSLGKTFSEIELDTDIDVENNTWLAAYIQLFNYYKALEKKDLTNAEVIIRTLYDIERTLPKSISYIIRLEYLYFLLVILDDKELAQKTYLALEEFVKNNLKKGNTELETRCYVAYESMINNNENLDVYKKRLLYLQDKALLPAQKNIFDALEK